METDFTTFEVLGYHRDITLSGTCIRCRKVFSPAVLTRGKGEEAFSFNMCDSCLTTLSMVSRLKSNGDIIWECNRDIPKNCYLNLKRCALDPHRNERELERAKIAKFEVLKGAKAR